MIYEFLCCLISKRVDVTVTGQIACERYLVRT